MKIIEIILKSQFRQRGKKLRMMITRGIENGE
jgi:hypothetical protein